MNSLETYLEAMKQALLDESFPMNSEKIIRLHKQIGAIVTETKLTNFSGYTAVVNDKLSYSVHSAHPTFIVNMNVGGRLFRLLYHRRDKSIVVIEKRYLRDDLLYCIPTGNTVPVFTGLMAQGPRNICDTVGTPGSLLMPKDIGGYYCEIPSSMDKIISSLEELVRINMTLPQRAL